MQNRKLAVGLVLGSIAGLSQAAIDVAPVTSAIGEAATAGATVGAAVLVMHVGIRVYKWLRGAM